MAEWLKVGGTIENRTAADSWPRSRPPGRGPGQARLAPARTLGSPGEGLPPPPQPAASRRSNSRSVASCSSSSGVRRSTADDHRQRRLHRASAASARSAANSRSTITCSQCAAAIRAAIQRMVSNRSRRPTPSWAWRPAPPRAPHPALRPSAGAPAHRRRRSPGHGARAGWSPRRACRIGGDRLQRHPLHHPPADLRPDLRVWSTSACAHRAPPRTAPPPAPGPPAAGHPSLRLRPRERGPERRLPPRPRIDRGPCGIPASLHTDAKVSPAATRRSSPPTPRRTAPAAPPPRAQLRPAFTAGLTRSPSIAISRKGRQLPTAAQHDRR